MNIEVLRELFEDNFEELKFETGRSINLNMKEFAWQQIKLYYEKLGDVAKNITESDVKLILPQQETPKGKKYTIEGFVNIAETEDKVTMYEMKAYNNKDIEANSSLYKEQLNVYAHILKNLRGVEIDSMAIIATEPPTELRDAMNIGDDDLVNSLIDGWNPIIELSFDEDDIRKEIENFGQTVDKIEDGEFKPPTLSKLKETRMGQKAPFGTAVCRHCDARYSCSSYGKYINGDN